MENADGVKGHHEPIGENTHNSELYDKYVKRILDIILSGMGLIIFSLFMLQLICYKN